MPPLRIHFLRPPVVGGCHSFDTHRRSNNPSHTPQKYTTPILLPVKDKWSVAVIKTRPKCWLRVPEPWRADTALRNRELHGASILGADHVRWSTKASSAPPTKRWASDAGTARPLRHPPCIAQTSFGAGKYFAPSAIDQSTQRHYASIISRVSATRRSVRRSLLRPHSLALHWCPIRNASDDLDGLANPMSAVTSGH